MDRDADRNRWRSFDRHGLFRVDQMRGTKQKRKIYLGEETLVQSKGRSKGGSSRCLRRFAYNGFPGSARELPVKTVSSHEKKTSGSQRDKLKQMRNDSVSECCLPTNTKKRQTQ